jgi:hypothetical protein
VAKVKIMDKQAEIAEAAYYIWERKGRQSGNALECWLEAEAEHKTAATVRKHMAKIATHQGHHQKAA